MTLPVPTTDGGLAIIDPDTGELLELADASDRALLAAAEKVAEVDRELFQAKRTLAAELRARHGIGTVRAGGYEFKVTESQSWPLAATLDALARLVASGAITEAEAERAMPAKPKPNTMVLKSMAARLAVTDPDAAKVLAAACTVSPPSVRDLHAVSVDATPADPKGPRDTFTNTEADAAAYERAING